MRPVGAVVLDNEAVQALLDVRHRKHRRVLAALEVVTSRPAAGTDLPRVVVPTSVRVEAGWDRRARGAATINRLRVDDAALDAAVADGAARIRAALGLSVADAHIAAILERGPGPFAVLTSDVEDVRRIAAHLDIGVNVVAL
ncbi:MAG: hypothetical protein ACT4RN_15670 [Pseudonocardia sp.]